VWLAIEAQFLGNRESRVLQLDVRFHVFKQGNLSVSDYCHWMKGLADDLRALGETVTDRHLILNLLKGLNKRFDHMKMFIQRSQSFPSFHTIHNDLELEEIVFDNSMAQGWASVFYSVPSGGGCPPQQQLPPRLPQQEPSCPPVAPPPTPNNGDKGKGKGKGKNNDSGSSSNNIMSSNTSVWPTFYNLWTGTISMWSGIHPPQQPTHPPHHILLAAPMYYDTPTGPSFASLPTPPPHQQQAAISI
jgi:hypothetical protein